jgi:hypothetical protein
MINEYIMNRRVRFTEYELKKNESGYSDAIPKHHFGFCVGEKIHSGRYPQFSSDFDIVTYIIECDDGEIVYVFEDDVLFLGWKRRLV